MKNLSLYLQQRIYRGIFLGSILFFYTVVLSGQYGLIHQHPSDQVNRNDAIAITEDGSGNTYLAGDFMNTITLGAFTLTTIPNPGNGWPFSAFIGKYNSGTGNWIWAKNIVLTQAPNYNGSNPAHYVRAKISDMAVDAQGNIYITGEYAGTVSFDNITLTSTKQGAFPTNDIFIAKLNPNGNFLWAKSFGSKAGWDGCYSIAVDGSNNVYAGGFFTNKVVSCDGTNVDKYDAFVVKLNNTGTALWQKRYASTLNPCGCTGCNISNNYVNDVTTDASGNVYITGTYLSSMSFGNGPALTISSIDGTNDVFVAKLNSSGTTQWVKSAGTSGLDVSNALYIDPSGNAYAGGKMPTIGFVSKYSTTGNLLWTVNPYSPSATFPGSNVTRVIPYDNSLLVNDAFIGFKTLSMSDGTTISTDSLVGNKITGNMFIKDVEAAGSGYVFNLNGRCGYISIDNLLLTASCTSGCTTSCSVWGDMVMVRNTPSSPPPAFNSIRETNNVLEEYQQALDIYPNPAKDILEVDLAPSEHERQLFIQDRFGKVIWSSRADQLQSSLTIDLNNAQFPNGIYYLISQSNGQIETKRFVVVK